MSKKYLFAISLLMLMFDVGVCFSDQADDYYAQGVNHNNNGQWADAIHSFRQAITFRPNFPYAYHNMAHAYDNSVDFDNAISSFGKAIELDPNGPKHYYCRAVVYNKMGNFKQAIDDYNYFLRFEPNKSGVYHELGHLYEKTRQYDLAVNSFGKAMAIDPREPRYRQCYEKAVELKTSINNVSKPASVDNTQGDHAGEFTQDLRHALEYQPRLIRELDPVIGLFEKHPIVRVIVIIAAFITVIGAITAFFRRKSMR